MLLSETVRFPANRLRDRELPGFSLIEMATVIAILAVLMTVGTRLLHSTGPQARRAATDMLAGMIDQARTAAITSRSFVVLAVAEPGDLPSADPACRLGMFKVDHWPDAPGTTVSAVLMNRWRTLETGVVLIGGEVDGVRNPLDGRELSISYGANKPLTVIVHAIAFNSRGGLHYPTGSAPVVMRVAEGDYRVGKATPFHNGDTQAVSETLLKIGRVTARPYRIDG